MIEIQVHVATN